MASDTPTKAPRSRVAKASRSRSSAATSTEGRAARRSTPSETSTPPREPESGPITEVVAPTTNAVGETTAPREDEATAATTIAERREAPTPRPVDGGVVLVPEPQRTMAFAVTPQALREGLAGVVATIPRMTLPVLQLVMITTDGDSHVRVTATDLDTTVTRRIPAIVSEPGTALVPGKRLAEIAREIPDNCGIDISLREETVHVVCNGTRSRYRLPTVPVAEFPMAPCILWEEHALSLTGATLALLIERTAFAAATEESRPILNGVLWEISDGEMGMVATNGHRLSATRIKVPGVATRPSVILHPRALALVSRVAAESEEIRVAKGQNHVGFRGEEWEIIARTIEGPYPPYHQVIPSDNDKELTVDRGAITAALRRMDIVASSETHRIRLSLGEPTMMRVSVETPDLGAAHEDVPVEYAGDPLEIGFNALYLLEVLRCHPAGDVRLTFRSPERAATFEPVSDETGASTLMLVMPLRLHS